MVLIFNSTVSREISGTNFTSVRLSGNKIARGEAECYLHLYYYTILYYTILYLLYLFACAFYLFLSAILYIYVYTYRVFH